MLVESVWHSADPLGRALHLLRMSGVFYGRSEFTDPWGVALPAWPGCVMFHFVAEGPCRLELNDGSGHRLCAGELVLIPHGAGHCLTSGPGVRAVPLTSLPRELVSERYEILRHGGGGAPTTVLCGAVRFDDPAARRLIDLLPPLIRITHTSTPEGLWIDATLRLIAAEAGQLRPGGDTVITRLADILVIQAIRSWLDADPAARTGWLGALRDPRIGPAIALMHGDPAYPWTLTRLASEVSMSRSAFASRFTELVGEPAMQYLTHWRMQLARSILEQEDVGMGELARRLGYQSEAAFSRAFKRVNGAPPGSARREHRILAGG
ncbi:AraC family transcriptional regulator [Nocardia sp. 2]|uniref:AraC family transcriptional regulator n=1 Tax=Nocardia acididurans TaxID=2802282 RepID=A0ABS1M0R3_9NOCA|nr:AraC family transcriptional regulator [Nocardia acididurans]MBL1073795.1 AraC family transcriptional regulator [Nocardia acididurans]